MKKRKTKKLKLTFSQQDVYNQLDYTWKKEEEFKGKKRILNSLVKLGLVETNYMGYRRRTIREKFY